MHIAGPAIVCAVLPHGEHGAIVRALTPRDGLIAGYVRGGRSRRLRPVLLAGNVIAAEFRARSEEQLATLTAELIASRAGLLAEPLAAAGIDWTTALAATALPEGQAYPHIHDALEGVLGAIEAAPSARGWATSLVRYELLMLAELGFGLDLTRCAAGGDPDDLAYVSPKSGCAVGRVAGSGYADRLLALPRFLIEGGAAAEWADVFAGLRLTGHFLERDLLTGRAARILPARGRLVDRLGMAGG